MARPKAQFKSLGTLPKAEWRVIVYVPTGAIILASAEHPALVIDQGKMTTLTDKEKTNGNEESDI